YFYVPAEYGIRDFHVTGVQTCALPICGHRRYIYAVEGEATIPGRYAIDWILLDDNGRYVAGDGNVVANRFGYGAEVLSVADGTRSEERRVGKEEIAQWARERCHQEAYK